MARKEALPAKINVIEVLDSDRDDEAVIRIAFQHGELVLRLGMMDAAHLVGDLRTKFGM